MGIPPLHQTHSCTDGARRGRSAGRGHTLACCWPVWPSQEPFGTSGAGNSREPVSLLSHATPVRCDGQWQLWLAHTPTREHGLPSSSVGHQACRRPNERESIERHLSAAPAGETLASREPYNPALLGSQTALLGRFANSNAITSTQAREGEGWQAGGGAFGGRTSVSHSRPEYPGAHWHAPSTHAP